MPRNKQEEQIHNALAEYIQVTYPEVYFVSDPSGDAIHKLQNVRINKKHSLHKQVDMLLLEPRGRYHGMALELKVQHPMKGNKDDGEPKTEHIKAQQDTLYLLQSKGYYASFGIGLVHAIELVDYYLALHGKRPKEERGREKESSRTSQKSSREKATTKKKGKSS